MGRFLVRPDGCRAVRSVTSATVGEAWVLDGNYWGKVGPQIWAAAHMVVWVSPLRWRAVLRA